MTNPTQAAIDEREATITFDLSDGELTYLLRLLNAPGLLGYAPDSELDAAASALLADVLRARGFITQNDAGQFGIRDGLGVIIATGAVFGAAISLQVVDEQKRVARHWIYINPGVIVYHSMPQARVHRFATVPDALALATLTASIMGIDPNQLNKVSLEPVSIALADWEHIVEMNRNDQQESLAGVLEGAGLPAPVVTALTETGRRSVLTLLKPEGNAQVQSRTMLVFNSPSGYWMLIPQGDTMLMQPADARDVLDKLAEYLNAI